MTASGSGVASGAKTIRPMRSLLFVPGNRPDRMNKAIGLKADVLILDLEDSVPVSEKANARKCVAEFLEKEKLRQPILVRINSLDRGFAKDDLKAALHPGVSGVVLPKADTAADVLEMAADLDSMEKGARLAPGSLKIVALIESARGLMHVAQTAGASPRVVALAFGAEDYAFDMGMQRSEEGEEILYPRSLLAVAARACGIFSIDTPYVNVRDQAGLVKDAGRARSLGFTGKFALHPDQISPINQTFAPSMEEIEKAREIVDGFETAMSRGSAVTVVGGRMVDVPVYENARKLLEFASSIDKAQRG